MNKDDSTRLFDGLGKLYQSARPDYPCEAIDYIIKRAGLQPGRVLADIGSGTGIASRLFAIRGINVIGIEPSEDMRAAAQNETSSRLSGEVRYAAGTATDTGLSDGSVDAVVAAQSFHWFDPGAALEEFARILKPHGWVILMWNDLDTDNKFTAEYKAILKNLTDHPLAESKRADFGAPLMNDPHYFESVSVVFHNSQRLDREGLIARAFSSSYAPRETEASEKLRDALSRLFDEAEKNLGLVELCYQTVVYTARLTN